MDLAPVLADFPRAERRCTRAEALREAWRLARGCDCDLGHLRQVVRLAQ